MLLIINMVTGEVLKTFDAWSETCIEDAEQFVNENGLDLDWTEVNYNGDMFWWVLGG